MNSNQPEEQEFFLSPGDCIRILKKGAKKTAACVFIFAFILGAYGLIRPVEYYAEATFREKGNSQGAVGTSSSSSLTSYLLNGFSDKNKSEAKTMMLSKKLLNRVVEDLDLQGALSKKTRETAFIKNIGKNLIVEYFYLKKYRNYPLPEENLPINAVDINYTNEIPRTLTLFFDDDHLYKVFDSNKVLQGEGRVGAVFKGEDFRFTLNKGGNDSLGGDIYYLTLEPKDDVASRLAEEIVITSDAEDTSLLRLSFSHRDRHFTSQVINHLMYTYQLYLREEQNRISEEQIVYLNRREKEINDNLRVILDEYANRLSDEVSETGYAHSSKALEFLTKELQTYHQKEMKIYLDLKRENYLRDHHIPLDSRYQLDTSPTVLNDLLVEIRELNQLTDLLELALRNSSSKDLKEWQKSFSNQIEELSDIRRCVEDAKVILASLQTEKYPLPSVALFEHPKYLVRSWNSQLLSFQEEYLSALPWKKGSKKEELDQFSEQFISYLTNLLHILKVNENIIEERLAHQQAPQFEFQGIDLETSKELYINYSRQLSVIEGKILQLEFMLDQLQKDDFEVSSLSSVIDDPIVKDIVDNASKHMIAILDDSNSGIKEKVRLKKELDVQKRFLSLHLAQTVDLQHLKENLIKNKIHSLQNASLELTQQKISILENQFKDASDTHLSSLKQEMQLINQYTQELKKELSLLPKKWANERLIEHQIKMNSKMVEELTKLVESKNINYNLEIIQSAPLDPAVSPVRPSRPKVALFATLGALLGMMVSFGLLLINAIVKGVPASLENLELSGFNVSGTVGINVAADLAVWRRIIAFFSYRKQEASSMISGIGSCAVDSMQGVCETLSKRGESVLLINLDVCLSKESTLLQYLEGDVDSPHIFFDSRGFDRIEFGDETLYAQELCESSKMQEFILSLKKDYRWIIVASSELLISPFTDMLVKTFDSSVLFVKDEKLSEIQRYPKERVTVVCCS